MSYLVDSSKRADHLGEKCRHYTGYVHKRAL